MMSVFLGLVILKKKGAEDLVKFTIYNKGYSVVWVMIGP
jgi:hypothetical protein